MATINCPTSVVDIVQIPCQVYIEFLLQLLLPMLNPESARRQVFPIFCTADILALTGQSPEPLFGL